ncbi:hypothetical protein SAMN02745165_03122 [Malonomonas rubra DSM 5091]|uniref:Uncharacterized protein n=1 Tax=Malonomonas rubra DSM 5091 TaxID=1122189 RepID=A0A1M6LZZ6_MALRU|nr:contractile injection system tape measure protein [Malonomonas rubra]SHJ76754.1 hypothetical protein SAMN02745165_03122 [Malonomonas rubra DSM 5091]
MEHLIQRQILELKFASQDDARFWMERLPELNRQVILTELEQVFDELAGGQNLRLEQLQIDLGRLRRSDLEHDLAQLVRQKVREALQPHLGQLPHNEKSPGLATLATRKPRLSDKQNPASHLDAASLEELFEQFLQSGHFPWWLQREASGQLDQLYQAFLLRAPDAAGRLLRQAISEPDCLVRLVEQFSNRSHKLTLSRLLPAEMGALLFDLRKVASLLLARRGGGQQARALGFKLIYGMIAVDNQQWLERPNLLARQFFTSLERISGVSPRELAKEVDGTVSGLKLMPATLALLADMLRQPDAFSGQQELDRDQREKEIEPGAESDSKGSVAGEIDIAVANAGLVLLWPHLAEILRKLDLLEKLIDGSKKPKVESVLLLQQLVTGRPAGQENLLFLNKLLCGLPANAPVPRRLRPNQQWVQESENLLKAVIAQWAVLKNTSVNGVRSGFLQRDGILREQGEGWLLQVERKPQDILLEQLPWGLGMIRFSWMQRPLIVEW